MIVSKSSAIALMAGVIAVAGCATSVERDSREAINTVATNSSEYLEDQRADAEYARHLVRSENEYYVSPDAKKIVLPLPERFSDQVSLTSSQPANLTDVAKQISEISGYRVVIRDEVFEFLKDNSEQLSTVPLGALNASGGLDRSASGASGGSTAKIQINYRGNLKGLLDRFASAAASYWVYDREDKSIEVFRYQTKTFEIAAIPGNTKGQGSIQGNSASGTETSTSNSSVATDYTFDLFKSIESSIKAMMSENGRFFVAPDLTSVTVTDVPPVIKEVISFVENTNKEMTKEVIADLTILTVTIKDSSSYGINWNAVYQGANTSFLFNTARQLSGFGMITGTVVNPNSRFNGTQAMIDALSKQGDVSVETQTTLRTLNNQVVPVQVGQRISYISDSSIVLNDNQSQTSTTTDEISVGLSLNLTPHILRDSTNILMQLGLNLSTLDSLTTTNVGQGQIIQTPQISSRDTLERFQVKSGQLMVISGFERNSNNSSNQRVLPLGWLPNFLGGERSTDKTKEIVVILVRPVVVDGSERI